MFNGDSTTMQVPTRNGVSEILSTVEIEARLHARYRASGYSDRTWTNDRALLRRINRSAGHPANVTVEDMEDIVLSANLTNSRSMYVERFKSLWTTMRELNLIPKDARPDEELPKIRRTKCSPRPLSDAQAMTLMRSAAQPMRDWFLLGCMSGLRAMEVSGLRGSDLEHTRDGYVLRVRGKGNTELTIPAHSDVVNMIQSHVRLGRLWTQNPLNVSKMACAEMRRLGIDMHFHCCRHYFATSVLAASGGDIVTTSNLMRHSSIQTTMGYAKLGDDRPRSILERLAGPHAA